MTTLPPYNEFSRCPKCDGNWITKTYRRAIVPHTPEHLELHCEGCGYTWRVRPVTPQTDSPGAALRRGVGSGKGSMPRPPAGRARGIDDRH